VDDKTRSMMQGGSILSDRTYVGEKVDTLRRILQIYSPTFDIIYNPEGKVVGDRVCNFAILESPPGVEPYIVRFLATEDLDNPTSIRDWVAAGDTRRNKPADILARIEMEEQIKLQEKKRLAAARHAEHADFAATVVRGGSNKLHTFRHGGRKYE
jgi:hypothetical protein